MIDSKNLNTKLKKIELLLLDVDGVLTDGSIIYTDEGSEIKIFNVKDGLGIRLLIKLNIQVGIITGRRSKALWHRCKNLGIDYIFDGCRDKSLALDQIVEQTGIPFENIAFIGDDIVDFKIMGKVGLPIAVADAHKIIIDKAVMVTLAKGGSGAVREICEVLLKAKGYWHKIEEMFL